MWCRNCHREVSVEAADMAGAACPLCNRPLSAGPVQTDSIRHAREILERWQSTDLFERISSTAPLAKMKQQDRAPLLNIPLGPKPVQPTASVSPGPLPQSSGAGTVSRRVSSTTVFPAQSASSWESLIAPPPLLAATAPPLEPMTEHENLVAPSIDQNHRNATDVVASGLADLTTPGSLDDASQGQKPSDHRERRTAATSLKPDIPMVPLDYQKPSSEDVVAESIIQSIATAAESQTPAVFPPNGTDLVSEIATASGNSSPEQRDVPAVSAVPPIEKTFSPDNRADAAPDTSSAESPASASVLQTSPPVPMSSVSIREEPANAVRESAESANQTKQEKAASTKKHQRTSLRRPPLHRRFQLERPVSASSAGSIAVTRNLRLDQPGGEAENPPVKEQDTPMVSSVAPETKIVSNSPKPGRRFRIDNAEPLETVTGTDGRRSRTQGIPRHRYIDEAHPSQLPGPHFEVGTPRRSNLTSMTGQFLAYLGVLGLTIGTAMVIYGHFGGYSEYTPTGWLVTTVAQMLLFLGVINLVSGGIEQNNDEVSRRMNSMGEQLLRIEQVTSEVLRGPKLSPRLYADPDAEVEESSRETASTERD